MALDFPDSPSNGQYYEGFVYDSTAGVWRVTKDPALVPVEYLVIGGGAGAGYFWGGGGGAGGYRCNVSGESSGGGLSAEAPLSL